ncbi:MAG: SGNH/GDSL hydrolase family protein [Armatimonadetes bacterium]|nr:SGNH/GDSL hydrolase family protein [Armatimonadota bacterium]
MILQPNQKLLFIGDSVTDGGRARPDGEGLFDALGKAYPALVDALLETVYPERAIRVVNQGASGNTVRDLAARWETDVLAHRPDWLSICIGINDVWRQFDSPRRPEIAVPIGEYRETLARLCRETRPLLPGGLVLIVPFYIEASTADAMRSRMDEYGAAVKQIAADNNAVFVDAQRAFDNALLHRHSAALAWDRVHPNPAGQMILAKAFLDALGFVWTRGE